MAHIELYLLDKERKSLRNLNFLNLLKMHSLALGKLLGKHSYMQYSLHRMPEYMEKLHIGH